MTTTNTSTTKFDTQLKKLLATDIAAYKLKAKLANLNNSVTIKAA